MSEPREFWLLDDDDKGGWFFYENQVECDWHVIEYSAYAKLQAESKILRDALEFYANNAHWTTHDHEMLFINVSDLDWHKPNGYFCGGKIAREALSKTGGENEK